MRPEKITLPAARAFASLANHREDWLEQIPFSRTSILVIRVLLLHNFLRRPLSLQHPECG